MMILGKRADGYLIRCEGRGKSHNFVLKTLGAEVCCPTCGRRDPSVVLATDYIFMQHSNQRRLGRAAARTQAANPIDVANDYVFAHRRADFGT